MDNERVEHFDTVEARDEWFDKKIKPQIEDHSRWAPGVVRLKDGTIVATFGLTITVYPLAQDAIKYNFVVIEYGRGPVVEHRGHFWAKPNQHELGELASEWIDWQEAESIIEFTFTRDG